MKKIIIGLLLFAGVAAKAQFKVTAPFNDIERVKSALIQQGFPITAVNAQELTTGGVQYFVKDTHWENNIYIRVQAHIEGDYTVLTADYGYRGGHWKPVLDHRICKFSKSILEDIAKKL